MEFVHLNYFETKKDIGKEIKAFVQKNFSKTIKKTGEKERDESKKDTDTFFFHYNILQYRPLFHQIRR